MASAAVAAVVARPGRSRRTPVGVVPVGPGAHRDLAFEQRSRLGADTAPQLMLGPLSGQPAIDGGRRHRHQQRGGVLVDVQLSEMAQHRHQFAEHRRQPLAGGHSQHRPAHRQRRDDLGPVLHWPRTSRGDDLGLQRRCERLAGMVAMPPRVGAQLVENPALAALARQLVTDSRSSPSPLCARPTSTPSYWAVRAHFSMRQRISPFARISDESTRAGGS